MFQAGFKLSMAEDDFKLLLHLQHAGIIGVYHVPAVCDADMEPRTSSMLRQHSAHGAAT